MEGMITHNPCVFKDTDFFQIKVCQCGVTHIYFGPTTLNLSPEAVDALTANLKQLAIEREQRKKTLVQNSDGMKSNPPGINSKGVFQPRIVQ